MCIACGIFSVLQLGRDNGRTAISSGLHLVSHIKHGPWQNYSVYKVSERMHVFSVVAVPGAEWTNRHRCVPPQSPATFYMHCTC
jgi:hypothetical protein